MRATAGLPHLRSHDLRSIGLSIMTNRGVSLRTLKEIARHSDVRITAARFARMADATPLKAVQVGSRAIESAAAASAPPSDAAKKAANEETAQRQPEARPRAA